MRLGSRRHFFLATQDQFVVKIGVFIYFFFLIARNDNNINISCHGSYCDNIFFRLGSYGKQLFLLARSICRLIDVLEQLVLSSEEIQRGYSGGTLLTDFYTFVRREAVKVPIPS